MEKGAKKRCVPVPAELRNDRYRTRHHIGNTVALSVCSANLRLELPVRNSDLPAHQKASEPCLDTYYPIAPPLRSFPDPSGRWYLVTIM